MQAIRAYWTRSRDCRPCGFLVGPSKEPSGSIGWPAYLHEEVAFRPGRVIVTVTSTVEKVWEDQAQPTETVEAVLKSQVERAVPAPGAPPLVPGVVAVEDRETGGFAGGTGWVSAQRTVVQSSPAEVVTQCVLLKGSFHLCLTHQAGDQRHRHSQPDPWGLEGGFSDLIVRGHVPDSSQSAFKQAAEAVGG